MGTDYYIEENRNVEGRKEITSPSGRYKLVIDQYTTGKGTWAFSRGRVYDTVGEEVCDVRRNYSAFPATFVEDHPDGHDYLICGSNYQGQTFVRLDTGDRVDHLPTSAAAGHGFCWAEHHPSPDKSFLAVDGCYWACPYEVVVYDLSSPMDAPLELARFGGEFLRWEGETLVTHTGWIDVRESDGVKIDDLPEEEWPDDDDWGKIPGEESRWTAPSREDIARTYLQKNFYWKLDSKWEMESPRRKVVEDMLLNARRLLYRLDPEVRKQVEQDMRWEEIEALPRWDWTRS